MAGAKADVDAETGDGGGAGAGAGGGGSGGSFSEQRLIDKLNRLNNSATSIQSILSSVFTLLHASKFGSLVFAVCFIFS
jgi:regulator of Ty1 transposition protein 103